MVVWMGRLIAAVCWIVLSNVATLAEELTPGNLLVCGDNSLCEHTASGKWVQSFAIPSSSDQQRGKRREPAHNCAVDHKGRVHVFNGNLNPTLSSLDPKTSRWEHHKIPGWSTMANDRYSGLDVFGDYVFLTDMRTHGSDGSGQGMIRFNLSDSSTTRFASEYEPIDVTIGFDGYLYVLHSAGTPSGEYAEVYLPSTLRHIRTVHLMRWGNVDRELQSDSHHAIAVDRQGNIFIADWYRGARKFDSDGNLLEVIDDSKRVYDIDVDDTGRVALCSEDGGTMLYADGTSKSILTPVYEKGLRFVRPPVDRIAVDPADAVAEEKNLQVAMIAALLLIVSIVFLVYLYRELRRG